MKKLLGLIAIVLLSPISAAAVTPKLSGQYVMAFSENCQAVLQLAPNSMTGDLQTVNTVDPGKLSETVGSASFNPTTHMFTLSGVQGKGSLVIFEGNGSGETLTQSPATLSAPYSNTATTVTINGTVFQAFYGGVSPSTEIAAYVDFLNVKPANGPAGDPAGCVERGIATHK